MTPENEERCLSCQETRWHSQPRVLDLPNLCAVRERVGLSREELEGLVGISRFRLHLVGECERRVKMRTARGIAAALGTAVDALSGETPAAVALRKSTTTTGKLNTRGAA